LRKAGRYFWRATLLKCPACGTRPIFPPLRRTRTLSDWFTPLDGCPRCGYPYDREPGYFLMATWGINYGVGAVLGITAYLLMEFYYADMPVLTMLLYLAGMVMSVNMLFARHSKAYFIALDHFFDPHIREDGSGGDDGGDQPAPGAPPASGPSGYDLPDAPAFEDSRPGKRETVGAGRER
jgi:predicted RNA-binding Zn-ribbon protein involved in translation (DUF1610 family)